MPFQTRAAFVAVLLFSVPLWPVRPAHGQEPTPASRPAEPGVISGRAFDAVTEAPLAGVTIRVIGQ
ncbi:MAG: hypothetical protein IPJ56_03625 [Gemmatimonadetes bacterium]|nr:hypothetical protein [Gemmatimonadota bacterium]